MDDFEKGNIYSGHMQINLGIRFFSLALAIVWTSCSPKPFLIHEGKKYKILVPPGTIKVDENVYADKTEISNAGYLLYLSWLEYVYGKETNTYLNALPDTTIWRHAEEELQDMENNYFRSQKLDMFPVIGITKEQAERYTSWRTDRVCEMILIQKKYIKMNKNSSAENHFTVERYITNDYEFILKHKKIPLPKYTLPTDAERATYLTKMTEDYIPNDDS